jgi:hypothetical protein
VLGDEDKSRGGPARLTVGAPARGNCSPGTERLARRAVRFFGAEEIGEAAYFDEAPGAR